MRKLANVIAVLALFFALPVLIAQDKQDVKAMKEKITQKVADMKAAGVPEEEINKFIVEAKKKIEQMTLATPAAPLDEKVLKEKLDQKIAALKAAGASDEDIKKAVLEFKAKAAQANGGSAVIMSEKEFEAKLKQKADAMRAAGASEDEVNRMITEAKLKRSEQTVKIQKQIR